MERALIDMKLNEVLFAGSSNFMLNLMMALSILMWRICFMLSIVLYASTPCCCIEHIKKESCTGYIYDAVMCRINCQIQHCLHEVRDYWTDSSWLLDWFCKGLHGLCDTRLNLLLTPQFTFHSFMYLVICSFQFCTKLGMMWYCLGLWGKSAIHNVNGHICTWHPNMMKKGVGPLLGCMLVL